MNPITENLSGKYINHDNTHHEDWEEEPVPMTYNLNHQKSYRNKDADKNFEIRKNSLSKITDKKEQGTKQLEYKGDINKFYTFEAQGVSTIPSSNDKEKNKFNAKTTSNSNNLYAFEGKLPLSDKVLNSRGEEIEIKLMPGSNSDKLVYTSIPSDVYFRPRKGDKTPKCGLTSEKKEFREEIDVIEDEAVSGRYALTEREELCYDNSLARQILHKAEDSENDLEEEQELSKEGLGSNVNDERDIQNSRKTLECVEKDVEHEGICDINHRHYSQIIAADVYYAENITEGNNNSNVSKARYNEDYNHISCKENSETTDKRVNTNLNQTGKGPAPNYNTNVEINISAKQNGHNTNISLDKFKGNTYGDKPSQVSNDNSNNNISSNTIPISLPISIPNPNNASKLKANTHNSSHQSNQSNIDSINHFNQYDIQQLTYDLVKEYSHLKINNDEDFMKRMLFDIFKRQTKEERMDKIIEQNKIKINEVDRIKTFNRLIEDANRRLEAQENLEAMKNKIFEQDSYSTSSNKKISQAEWEEIYIERFLKFKDQHEKWRHDQILEKVLQEKKKEDEIVSAVKTKKVAQRIIDENSKRMYEEAERRKLKLEESMRKKEGNLYEEKNSTEERELTPTKFKKKKNIQKYNFMSDVSGNEKSESESEGQNDLKISQNNLQESKDKKLKNKLLSKMTTHINKISKCTPSSFHGKNFLKNQENSIRGDKQQYTNSEINNNRFDRRITKTHNKHFNKVQNENSKLKLKEKEISKSANKKTISNSNHLKYDLKENVIYDHEKDEDECDDEDSEEKVPKPLRSHIGLDYVRLNDFKSNNNKSNNANTNVSQKAFPGLGTSNPNFYQQHIPDHLASKLVDEILLKRLEK